jgi:hypothetical protein
VLNKYNTQFHGFGLLKEDTRTSAKPRIGDGQTRRRSPRFKTFKGAELIWPNGVPVKCIVRNVSATGAKLEVFGPILRNVVDLIFDQDHSRRSCRVVWCKERMVGVEFLQAK